MPWEKSFERSKALEASMRVFWTKGYERTSYADLVTEAKASRYGLYDEFGDKHDLYLAVLDHYRDGPVTHLLGALAEENAGLQELKAYFGRLVDVFRSEGARNGCLMSLSAIALAPHDPLIAQKVQENFRRIRGLYVAALERAQQEGDWPEERSAQDVGAALYGIVQGAAVLQRGGEGLDHVADYVENSVALLI